jgi:protein phosphatase
VYSLVLQGGDRVILCSDGLTSMVRPVTIGEILREQADPTAAANALVDAANAAGGEDNITVVVLDAVAEAKDPLPSSVAAAIRPRGASGPPPPVEVVAPTAVGVVTTTTSMDTTEAPAATPAEPASAGPPRDTARFREPPRSRRVGRGIGRVLAFALPIVVIIGVGIAAIGWYARNSYFVAFSQGKVVVYQGRPGGVLLWDPTVVERTTLRRARLTDDFRQSVSEKKEFDSKDAALAFVGRARANQTTTTTSTLPTTTTTVAAVPTVPTVPTSAAP